MFNSQAIEDLAYVLRTDAIEAMKIYAQAIHHAAVGDAVQILIIVFVFVTVIVFFKSIRNSLPGYEGEKTATAAGICFLLLVVSLGISAGLNVTVTRWVAPEYYVFEKILDTAK